MDRLLDHARAGPFHLRQPEIARLVIQALYDGETRFHRYRLNAFVVMPNHVHLLVTPSVPARKWLGPLKGFTAHESNRILGRRAPFWQDESYDHLIRNDKEFARVAHYIAYNPVKAGLAASPETFPWSGACGVSPSGLLTGFCPASKP